MKKAFCLFFLSSQFLFATGEEDQTYLCYPAGRGGEVKVDAYGETLQVREKGRGIAELTFEYFQNGIQEYSQSEFYKTRKTVTAKTVKFTDVESGIDVLTVNRQATDKEPSNFRYTQQFSGTFKRYHSGIDAEHPMYDQAPSISTMKMFCFN